MSIFPGPAAGGSPISVTASRALVSNSSGAVAASSVTATELGYLSGVTSAIQTQLNAITASAASWQTQSQASNGNSLTITFNASGAAFEVQAVILSNSASSLVDVEINGSAGSYTYYQQYNGTGASGAGSFINAGAAGSGSVETLRGTLSFNGEIALLEYSNGVTGLGVSQGIVYKTIAGLTALTSFTIKSNQANGIGAGSYIRVRKIA